MLFTSYIVWFNLMIFFLHLKIKDQQVFFIRKDTFYEFYIHRFFIVLFWHSRICYITIENPKKSTASKIISVLSKVCFA